MRKGSAVWGSNTILYGLVYLAVIMSLGHHIDHMIRGNHVGWPLTEYVTPFTYSLGIYPLILLGLFLYRSSRVGSGYWALLSGSGAVFMAWIHFGLAAVEPPVDFINLYEPQIVGWLAIAWLVAFVMVLVVTCAYEVRSWFAQRKARSRPGRGAASAIVAFLGEGKEGRTNRREADAPASERDGSGPARGYPHGLTARQVEVLRLLAGGRTNAEIAEELHVSVRTVERHVANIYAKIGTRGRANATAYVLTHNLI